MGISLFQFKPSGSVRLLLRLLFLLPYFFGGCGEAPKDPPNQGCAEKKLPAGGPNVGVGYAYLPDPLTASRDPTLSPSSLRLDDFRTQVSLNHLGGKGVLEGSFVDVRNGRNCEEWYLASDSKNQFLYPQKDFRFQEANAYYHADRFRSKLNDFKYLQPEDPVRVVVHCKSDDNSYFVPFQTSDGRIRAKVCLGDSTTSKGASYADDGQVTVHELQHSTTVGIYTGGNFRKSFNQLGYDEAGALNEAISDFMALIEFEPEVSVLPNSDVRLFSHWALNRFEPRYKWTRGAHKCPQYIRVNCDSFLPFSSKKGTLSYIYPDGMGWPFPDNYQTGISLREIFDKNPVQEQIHNTSVLMTGALWDVYEALKNSPIFQSPSGKTTVRADVMKLVLESIGRLPFPSSTARSPITYRGFSKILMATAESMGFSKETVKAVENALVLRGLSGTEIQDSNWAEVGPGSTLTPGVKIVDEPAILKIWLGDHYKEWVPQGIQTGINDQLDPGELAVIWFDIKNVSQEGTSVGAVTLSVTIPNDAPLTFADVTLNPGVISEKNAQVMLSKINGRNIVTQFKDSLILENNLNISNHYFKTNPFFSQRDATGFWITVNPAAKHGEVIQIDVEALPSNGPKSPTLHFPVTIH